MFAQQKDRKTPKSANTRRLMFSQKTKNKRDFCLVQKFLHKSVITPDLKTKT